MPVAGKSGSLTAAACHNLMIRRRTTSRNGIVPWDRPRMFGAFLMLWARPRQHFWQQWRFERDSESESDFHSDSDSDQDSSLLNDSGSILRIYSPERDDYLEDDEDEEFEDDWDDEEMGLEDDSGPMAFEVENSPDQQLSGEFPDEEVAVANRPVASDLSRQSERGNDTAATNDQVQPSTPQQRSEADDAPRWPSSFAEKFWFARCCFFLSVERMGQDDRSKIVLLFQYSNPLLLEWFPPWLECKPSSDIHTF